MPIRDENKPKEIDLFGNITTLDEFFKKSKEYTKEINELDKKLKKESAENQHKELINYIKEYHELGKYLDENDEKARNKLQKEFLKKYQKEKLKKEVEDIKKVYDTRNKLEKVFKGAKDKIDSTEDNRQIIKSLKELSKHKKLTEEQEKELKGARKELYSGYVLKDLKNMWGNLKNSFNYLSNQISSGIDNYAKLQSSINTRLQGSRGFGLDNIYSTIEERLLSTIGMTPYIKTEDLMNNLQSLVKQGISSNVEQRAFLQTVKEDVAATFDAANGSLLRLIRLQKEDSTAARLGMEAYLTRYLNELTDNTEYLNQTFDNVQDALIEASSQMTADASTQFEFIVQKWLGTMTGVGLSSQTATSIAQAIGYLGSGNIEALGGTDLQNLLVMSASKGGLDYSRLLTEGLTAETTNRLMESLVDFVIDIGKSQSNVIKSQYAKTFGLTISDLEAISNLENSTELVSRGRLSENDMLNELFGQIESLGLGRMSQSELISNSFSNLIYAFTSKMARNPGAAATWKITDLIQSVTGGINIPSIMAFGTGVDLNTTVENLVKTGLVGANVLGMIGDVITGATNVLQSPSDLLSGILGLSQIHREGGLSAVTSGFTHSLGTTVAGGSSEDVYESTLGKAYGETGQKIEAKQDEEAMKNPVLEYLNTKLDNHMINLISKVESIDKKLDGEIKVDISDSDIAGLTTGLGGLIEFPF